MKLDIARRRLAAATLFSATIAVGTTLSAAAAPTALANNGSADTNCPAGEKQLAAGTQLYTRSETRIGDRVEDVMTPVATLTAPVCVKDTGDIDGGKWAQKDGKLVKDTDPDTARTVAKIVATPRRLVETTVRGGLDSDRMIPTQSPRGEFECGCYYSG
jgi:hypothetical protein